MFYMSLTTKKQGEQLMKINRRKFMASTGAAAGMGLIATTGVAGTDKGVRLSAEQIKADKEIADVLNFVMNSWGNKAKIVTIAEVKASQKKK